MHTEGSLEGTPDEPPRWRLFYNRSYTLVPSYPLHFVVPAVMSDANVRCGTCVLLMVEHLVGTLWRNTVRGILY